VTPNPPRRAQRADLPALAALWSDLVEQHAALDAAFALRAGADSALEAELARELDDADRALFVCDTDGRPVGFCAVQVQHGPAVAVEARRAEITELVVARGARRGGRGRALVEAALAWARERGAARVEVRVASRNAEGQAFWRSLGFGAFVDVLDRRL
jgi:ribosomal protein S18 acetylase RimI-like enzyme